MPKSHYQFEKRRKEREKKKKKEEKRLRKLAKKEGAANAAAEPSPQPIADQNIEPTAETLPEDTSGHAVRPTESPMQ